MSSLQRYLELVSRGETVYRAAVLRLLPGETLYVPIVGDQVVEEGELVISVVTLVIRERRYFLAFTAEDLIVRWSRGRARALALHGADFVAVIPRNTWLMLNPEQPEEFELTPRDIERVIDLAAPSSAPIEFSNERLKPLQGILAEFAELFRSHREVLQACYLPPNHAYPGGLLGIIAPGLHSDMRLLVVSEIGRISRSFFGSAGAVEVFADDEEQYSPLWDLMQGIPPFYDLARGGGVEAALSGKPDGRGARVKPFRGFRVERDKPK